MNKKDVVEVPLQLLKAIEIDQAMGSPLDSCNLFSFARAVADDEVENYPENPLQQIYKWGLQEYLIPKAYGGSQISFEEVAYIIRIIARRDATVALSYCMPFLGVVPVWLRGSDSQIQEAVEILRKGGRISLGLTEKEHGSDILSNELQITTVADGFVLNGSKWLINHTSKGQAINCYARIKDKTGPRAYSFIFVVKNKMKTQNYSLHPKIHTLGMRGADMGGITFNAAFAAEDSLVGKPGDGLEIMLKGFHITRMMASCLQLGAIDTAFRVTCRFALDRILYKKPVFALPHAQESLVRVFLNICLADSCSLFGLKVLNHFPEKACLYACMVKAFAPSLLENGLHDLSVVLGARYYLRDEYFSGIFQKISRDMPVVRFGDGNTLVNLQAILFQTKDIYNRKTHASVNEDVSKVFDFNNTVPPFNFGGLTLSFKGVEIINHEWSHVKQEIISAANDRDLAALLNNLDERYQKVIGELCQREGCPGYEEPYAHFKLAERWCLISSLIILTLFWQRNKNELSYDPNPMLKVLLIMHLKPDEALPATEVKIVAEEINRRMQEHLLFGIHSIPLENSF